MRLCAVCVLLVCCVCVFRVHCSLPDFTPASARPQVKASGESSTVSSLMKSGSGSSRLPGLCRRLKRRRVTILCHREKFCFRGQAQTGRTDIRSGRTDIRSGQVCVCPRGSRCSHFFVHSL